MRGDAIVHILLRQIGLYFTAPYVYFTTLDLFVWNVYVKCFCGWFMRGVYVECLFEIFILFSSSCLFHNVRPACVKCLCGMFMGNVYVECLFEMFINLFLLLIFISQCQTCLCKMFMRNVLVECLFEMFINLFLLLMFIS